MLNVWSSYFCLETVWLSCVVEFDGIIVNILPIPRTYYTCLRNTISMETAVFHPPLNWSHLQAFFYFLYYTHLLFMVIYLVIFTERWAAGNVCLRAPLSCFIHYRQFSGWPVTVICINCWLSPFDASVRYMLAVSLWQGLTWDIVAFFLLPAQWEMHCTCLFV